MSTPLAQNHFQLFGLAQSYALDGADLAARYRELQSRLHPDRFATAGAVEKRIAAQHAAQVNEAFQTLRDPQRRAQYLLTLAGVSDGVGEKDTTSDRGFLMEQMELREALDDASAASDAADQLAKLETRLDGESRRLEQEFGEAWTQGEMARGRAIVQKMQFFRRLREDVVHRLEQVDG